MTVQSAVNRADYDGNGVTVEFAVPFRFLANSHVRAVRSVIATGVETELVLDSGGADGFTVTGAGQPSGGEITVVTAPVGAGATQERITILRKPPLTQLLDFIANDSFPAESHERALDLLTMICGQQQELLDRAMVLPAGVVGVSTSLPTPQDQSLLGWSGNALANLGSTFGPGDLTLRPDLAAAVSGKGSDIVTYLDGIAPVYLKTVSDIINGMPVNLLRNVDPDWWSDLRDGVLDEDLSGNILDLLDAMGQAKRGHLILPWGVTPIKSTITMVDPVNVASFRITGEDWANSIIRRTSDYVGSVINISGISNFVLENLRIDGGHDLYPTNGNHGFSISNGSHIRCRNLQIINYKNTAGLIFQFPNDTRPLVTEDNVIEGCVANGGGVANNGFLIGDGQYSGIRNCLVKDLGQGGSPQYALQIKGISHRCFITGSIAINARAGIALGQETVEAEAVIDSVIANCIVQDCVWGIYAGLGARNTFSNISIDMNNLGSSAIELADCVGNTIDARVYRARDAVGVAAVEFTGTSSDNFVHLREFHQSGTGIRAAIFESTTTRNTVELDRYVGTGTITRSQQMVVDSSTSSTNIFDFKRGVNSDVQVIASDAIRVAHARIQAIRLDTEASAASDNLQTINGPGFDGQIVTFYTVNSSRDVVIKHSAIGTGGGAIFTKTAADVTLTTIAARIVLQYDSSLSMWCEI